MLCYRAFKSHPHGTTRLLSLHSGRENLLSNQKRFVFDKKRDASVEGNVFGGHTLNLFFYTDTQQKKRCISFQQAYPTAA